MKTIKVILDWFPNTNHTGFFVALHNGWYAAAGLDVQIGGKVHGVMEAHDADIVVAPQPALLTGMENGDALTAVATLTQRNDSGILSLRESAITRPAALMGKRLTHWTPRWFHSVLRKAVEDDGGDYGDVTLVQKDVGDIAATLGHDADAVWIYKNWEYYVMKQAGKSVNYFAFADANSLFDFCAPSVSATHALVDNHPEALRAFLHATDRGYREAARDPDACAGILLPYMRNADVALVRGSQRYVSALYLDGSGRWGHMAPGRWEPFADFMVDEGLIRSRAPHEYTNEFLG